jgi:hypothetical protein
MFVFSRSGQLFYLDSCSILCVSSQHSNTCDGHSYVFERERYGCRPGLLETSLYEEIHVIVLLALALERGRT